MKKIVLIGIGVCLIIALTAGVYQVTAPVEEKADKAQFALGEIKPVSAQTVQEVQKTRVGERFDIYTPIIEQWEGSAHAKAADSPETTGHDAPYCYPCHSADYYYFPGDERPAHTAMKNGITCISCHEMDAQSFTLTEQDRVKLCTHCHNAAEGEPLEPGSEAHHGQAEIYTGEGAIGIPKTPNPKFQKGLACSDCHMPNQNHDFMALTPSGAAKENRKPICFMCHKEEDRKKFSVHIEALQKDVGGRKDKLLKELEELKKKIEEAKEAGEDTKALEKEYGIAYTNTTVVDSDKSRGVHHPEYVKLILADAEQRVAKLKDTLN